MERTRVVVLGLGQFGRDWAEIVARSAQCELAGLVDQQQEALAAARSAPLLTSVPVFTNLEQALNQSEAGAALIVISNDAHRDAAVTCLRAGLDVLCEKPLAANMAAARAIRDAVRRSGCVFMVSQNYRWKPEIQAMRGAIRSGAIGHVGYLNVEFQRACRFGGWREAMAEPLLGDMTVHHFDLIRYLTGKDCVRVYAETFRPSWSWYTGNPAASVLMEFQGGLRVSYFGSWVAQGNQTTWNGTWRISGSDGALQMASDLPVLIRGKSIRPLADDDAEAVPLRIPTMPDAERQYALREFLLAVERRVQPETNVEDNMQTFAISRAAIHSARTGEPVDVQAFLETGERGGDGRG